jgi:putative ABC transport system permease protein
MLPALQASRFQLNDVLKERGRGSSAGRGAQRSRSLLVIGEVALSLTLLAGAALLIESLVRLRAEPLGYRIEGLLMAHLDLPRAGYPGLPERLLFCDRLARSIAAVPGLRVAFRSTGLVHVEIAGGRLAARQSGFVSQNLVGPGYLAVAGIPLVAGRGFTPQDGERSQPVALVDREFARRYFEGQSPLGRHIRLIAEGMPSPWRTIVGEAADIKETNVFDEMHWKVAPHAYVPSRQASPRDGRRWTLMIRAGPRWLGPEDRPRDSLVSALRHAVSELDPNLPLSGVTSMRQFLNDQAFSKPAFRAVLLAVFAGLALIMAALGLYGALAQFVAQRRHDVGLRMALGATPGEVIRLVVRRSLILTAAGLAVGLAGAAVGTRLMRGFLLAGPSRPLVLLGVAVAMLVVALLAGLAPAWRAARIDPAVALREE